MLAAKATSDSDRVRWLGMGEFWLDRARTAEAQDAHQLLDSYGCRLQDRDRINVPRHDRGHGDAPLALFASLGCVSCLNFRLEKSSTKIAGHAGQTLSRPSAGYSASAVDEASLPPSRSWL